MKRIYITKKIKIQCLEYCIKCLKEMLITHNITGLCMCIRNFNDNKNYDINYFQGIEKCLPELLKYRPPECFTYWFPLNEQGIKKRITICRKVLKEFKNK